MPNTTATAAVLLRLFLILFALRPLCSTDHHRHRRILHQPFQPQDSVTPTKQPSPTPPPTPSYPFSSSTPENTPFFPFTYPSQPPPPSPASFASFPANISSLSVPSTSRSNSASSKLVIAAVAAVGAAVAVVSLTVFLHLRRRARNHGSSSFDHCKTQRSDNSSSVSFNQTPTTHRHIPKLQRPSQTSSEFLYLGTLVSAHAPGGGAAFNNVGSTVTTNYNNVSSDSRETDSPELRPLPSLNTQQIFLQNLRANKSSKEDESEEFYSPKGSINGRESSIGTGSASRKPFAAIVVEKFNEPTSNSSSTYSSSSVPGSGSGSPVRSVSLSLSPANNSSPRSSIPKSPDLIEIQTIGALPAQMPPPAEAPGSSFQESASPERNSMRSEESFPRVSNVSDHNLELPVNISTAVYQNTTLIPTAPEMEPDRPLLTPESEESSPRTSIVSENHAQSPVRITSSPHKHNSIDIQEPPLTQDLPPSPEYESGSPLISSSPEKPLKSSMRISNLFDQNIESSAATNSPARQTLPKDSNSPYQIFPEKYPTSEESSPRTSISSDKISNPVRHNTDSVIPAPPPPPPLPPSKLWGRPETPAKKPGGPPPVLIKPSGMVAVESPPSISPMEFPSSDPQLALHEENGDDNGLKPKLKPLHWDKVRASSDREMVWDRFKSSSFKLNEEMIETLFIVNTPKPKPNPNETTRWQVLPSPGQDNGDRVLDPKKSQNVAILLKALHVTVDEVCEGLLEGNADILGTELLESLLKMAPTREEERKLKECKDDSPVKLGAAERFLKAVVDIPFAFKRVEAMVYMSNFDSEVEYLGKSFATLEAACEELRNSRMFLKLLEAVLKTGNRMNVGTNRGDAHAFKLDTLLKLVDVKAADGKTTLLHFVVHEIVRSEGARILSCGPHHRAADDDAARCRKLGLPAVSSLGSDLSNVKKAAAMDADALAADVSKLSGGIETIREIADVMFLKENGGEKFVENVGCFVSRAEAEIFRVRAEESLARSLVKEITEYFHGNSALEGAHPFRIFTVVRDFLGVLDRVCQEVGMVNERTVVSSVHRFPVPVNPMLQPVSGPGVQARLGGSSGDDDDDDESLLPLGC